MRFVSLSFLLFLSFCVSAQKKKHLVLTPEQTAQAEALFAEGMKFSITDNYPEALKQFEQALAINPQNAGTLYMISKMYNQFSENSIGVSIGGYDKEYLRKAIDNAQKAVEIDPQNKYYRIYLAELYAKNHDKKKAIDIYEHLLKENPNDINMAFELANLHISNKDYEEAIKAYNKIEEITGITEEITQQKQLIYLRLNKLDEALKEGEKLIEEESGDPDLMIQQAQMLLSNDKLDEAQKWIEKALLLNQDNPEALIMLAEVYRKKGDIKACDDQLKKAFKNPNLSSDVKVKILSSYLIMQQNENSDANNSIIEMANELIKANPKETGAFIVLADSYARKGKKQPARDYYLKVIQQNPSIMEVWEAVLQLDNELGQTDSLAKHSEKAIEYFPNEGTFWYQNGFANYVLKNQEKGISSLEEAKNLLVDNPELVKNINALLGDAYNNLKNYEKSNDAYEAALLQDPDYDHVLNNYSYFLSLRKTDLEKAIKMSSKLVERNPADATYLDTHAWVLYMNANYKEARTFLEQAIKTEKGISGTIIEHYGDVLYQLNEKYLALEQWKKAKDLGEASDKIEEKIKSGKLVE